MHLVTCTECNEDFYTNFDTKAVCPHCGELLRLDWYMTGEDACIWVVGPYETNKYPD